MVPKATSKELLSSFQKKIPQKPIGIALLTMFLTLKIIFHKDLLSFPVYGEKNKFGFLRLAVQKVQNFRQN
jgi:hypothetical protein